MCGIIAVLRKRSDRTPPTSADLLVLLDGTPGTLRSLVGSADGDAIDAVARRVEEVDRLLRGTPGVRALLDDRTLPSSIDAVVAELDATIVDLEAGLDAGAVDVASVEVTNAAIVRLKDACWAVRKDRIPTARAVADLAGASPSRSALEGFTSIQLALSAIDRLEVRGRDSAGLEVLVHGHGLALDRPPIAALLEGRDHDPLYEDRAVRVTPEGHLSFVFKAAATIGELGDNTRALRAAIRDDALLHRALAGDDAEATILGHTRWASIGIISEPNAHPMSSDEIGRTDGPFVTAALNGDVDNFADVKVADALQIAAEITSDAKVIPTVVSRRMAAGEEPREAFRQAVGRFDGSVAIAASAASTPDRLLLALRGSGQALYVGLADDLYLVASEPYGVVEEAGAYLRMDGETPSDPDRAAASRGQVIELDAKAAGDLDGIRRYSYDGAALPVGVDELVTPEVTTRDIDRGTAAHFLLKEIAEAPGSFRKTLRGKVIDVDGRLVADLDDATLPDTLRRQLRDGTITRIQVIGQGTAAVAGASLARALTMELASTPIRVEGLPATELSGFALRPDMGDTLIVAISQSGTTTDTNRTVDLVRSRGAQVVSIVNRRRSDLTDKSDGVLYTSDGRDVEMSVASTKAFYAQIAAGFVLSSRDRPGRARRRRRRAAIDPPHRAPGDPRRHGGHHRSP